MGNKPVLSEAEWVAHADLVNTPRTPADSRRLTFHQTYATSKSTSYPSAWATSCPSYRTGRKHKPSDMRLQITKHFFDILDGRLHKRKNGLIDLIKAKVHPDDNLGFRNGVRHRHLCARVNGYTHDANT